MVRARVEQFKQQMTESVGERVQDSPVFVMGDFNSPPASNTLRLLYGKELLFGSDVSAEEARSVSESVAALKPRYERQRSFRSAYENYAEAEVPLTEFVGHPLFPYEYHPKETVDDFPMWKRHLDCTTCIPGFAPCLDFICY